MRDAGVGEGSDAFEMLLSCLGEMLKIPVHTAEFVDFVDVKLEAHLYDPFQLLELVIVCPGRQRKRPHNIFLVADGFFIRIFTELDVGILRIELKTVPVENEMAKHPTKSGSVHAQRPEHVDVDLIVSVDFFENAMDRTYVCSSSDEVIHFSGDLESRVLRSFNATVRIIHENVSWERDLCQIIEEQLLERHLVEDFHIVEDQRLQQASDVCRWLWCPRLEGPYEILQVSPMSVFPIEQSLSSYRPEAKFHHDILICGRRTPHLDRFC